MARRTNQDKAIEALIATNTVRDAAEQCGLSETTLYRYLRDPEFLGEFRARSRALYDAASGRILKASERAIYVLQRNMDCKTPAVETRSAQILLENAGKRIELDDILMRLEALENERNQQA